MSFESNIKNDIKQHKFSALWVQCSSIIVMWTSTTVVKKNENEVVRCARQGREDDLRWDENNSNKKKNFHIFSCHCIVEDFRHKLCNFCWHFEIFSSHGSWQAWIYSAIGVVLVTSKKLRIELVNFYVNLLYVLYTTWMFQGFIHLLYIWLQYTRAPQSKHLKC